MSRKSRLLLGPVIPALAFASLASHAATLVVPGQYATIQSAIDSAADSGDVVLVSAGRYAEDLLINDKSIDIRSTDGAKSTVVDGSAHGSVVHVSLRSGQTVGLSGLTLQNGSATEGGGVLANGSVIVEHCIIQHNLAAKGGGLALDPAAASIVRQNLIIDNAAYTSNGGGGGLYLFDGSPLIEGNVIKGNQSGYVGGGIFVDGGAPTLLRNIVSDNDSDEHWGGGMAIWVYDGGSPRIADNLVVHNSGGYGGGMSVYGLGNASAGAFDNNTVADNIAWGDEGYTGGSQLGTLGVQSHFVFANNIFSGYPSVACGGKFKPKSPKFFHNDVDGLAIGSCSATATTGTNLAVPAEFTGGDDAHPYHLSKGSPLVDAGSNRNARGLHRDLDAMPRIVDGGHGLKVDIGAYEFQPK